MNALKNSFAEIKRYPGAIAGLVIIVLLIIAAVVVVVAIPYDEAVRLWRGGEGIWYKNPKSVPPTWTNWFTRDDKPPSLDLAEGDEDVEKIREEKPDSGTVDIFYTYTFDYNYDAYPQEMILYMDGVYQDKAPFADIYWVMPDGTEIRVASLGIERATNFYFSQDTKLQRRVGGLSPQIGLFTIPDSDHRRLWKALINYGLKGLLLNRMRISKLNLFSTARSMVSLVQITCVVTYPLL